MKVVVSLKNLHLMKILTPISISTIPFQVVNLQVQVITRQRLLTLGVIYLKQMTTMTQKMNFWIQNQTNVLKNTEGI